jgi:hypothetical protein
MLVLEHTPHAHVLVHSAHQQDSKRDSTEPLLVTLLGTPRYIFKHSQDGLECGTWRFGKTLP